MTELVFVKLGGSLITDKQHYQTARLSTIERVAQEIAAARAQKPDLRLIIGHGSGSFGHYSALKYHVRAGDLSDWFGYAETSAAVQRLDQLVVEALLKVGVPVVPVQPSASASCRAGELHYLRMEPIVALLDHHAVPLVYGDVAIDELQGCTIISTEMIFQYLVHHLHPQRIVLAGEVDGVLDADPLQNSKAQLISEITADNYSTIEAALAGSAAVDVTGGMRSKVRLMWDLVQKTPGLSVRIVSGVRPGELEQVLASDTLSAGTILRR
ncbi:MAG: isopentenyl phosphate kinase [Anaerolineae bacterium]